MTTSDYPDPGGRPARLLAGVVGILPVLALLGYIADLPILVSGMPGPRGMSIVTAACTLMLAVAIALGSGRHRQGSRWLAALALATALAVLASHLLRGTDIFSPALQQRLLRPLPGFTPRTSVATALSVLMLASSMLLQPAHARLANGCSGVALAIAGTALLGYAYGTADLYRLRLFNGVALNTALTLLMLAIASIFAQPRQGWAAILASATAAGRVTRRQLAFTLLPPCCGWLLLRAAQAGQIGQGASLALLVVLTVVPLAMLVLKDGRSLMALEQERQNKAALQEDLRREMIRQLAEQAREIALRQAEQARLEAMANSAQRMETVGQLTGGIAHDFNNLLMSISGNLQLLKGRLAIDHPAYRYALGAGAAVDKGARLTSQLLTFSRTQRLNIRPLAVTPLLASARDLIGSSMGALIEIEILDESLGAWIQGDSDQLELALLNLAVNARDAMPGGGLLQISATLGEHALAAGAAQPCLLLAVRDNGAGMPAEVAARAAEPFFTTKERGKGTGLGLAQVHGLVHQCGGVLEIHSQPGAGTTIILGLPLAAVAPPERRAQAQAATGTSLVVHPEVLVIVDALREAGFRVTEASDGYSALDRLQGWRPDAAVIDFMMPGLNGADVARRAQLRWPGLPVVFVSGYADTIAMDGIAAATVLRKPFEMANLQRVLSGAVAA